MKAAEEKAVEKELQRLRRLPENRVCPNCLKEDKVGHMAVCWEFKTFICSECKFAHGAFSHRCKSVNMSVWKKDEVRQLDEQNGGGNAVAKRKWLANVPAGCRPKEGSPTEIFKRFIERAYILRHFAAEMGADGSFREVDDGSAADRNRGERRRGDQDRDDRDDRRDRGGRDRGDRDRDSRDDRDRGDRDHYRNDRDRDDRDRYERGDRDRADRNDRSGRDRGDRDDRDRGGRDRADRDERGGRDRGGRDRGDRDRGDRDRGKEQGSSSASADRGVDERRRRARDTAPDSDFDPNMGGCLDLNAGSPPAEVSFDPNASSGGFDPNAGRGGFGGFDPNAGSGGFDPNAGRGGFDPNSAGFQPVQTGQPAWGGAFPVAARPQFGGNHAPHQAGGAPFVVDSFATPSFSPQGGMAAQPSHRTSDQVLVAQMKADIAKEKADRAAAFNVIDAFDPFAAASSSPPEPAAATAAWSVGPGPCSGAGSAGGTVPGAPTYAPPPAAAAGGPYAGNPTNQWMASAAPGSGMNAAPGGFGMQSWGAAPAASSGMRPGADFSQSGGGSRSQSNLFGMGGMPSQANAGGAMMGSNLPPQNAGQGVGGADMAAFDPFAGLGQPQGAPRQAYGGPGMPQQQFAAPGAPQQAFGAPQQQQQQQQQGFDPNCMGMASGFNPNSMGMASQTPMPGLSQQPQRPPYQPAGAGFASGGGGDGALDSFDPLAPGRAQMGLFA